MTQRRINHQGKEATDREVCDVDDTVASRSVFRRTAPNASALQSIMLGTARSRDRMDECERARAKKKLEHLNATVKKH
ncbi:unnamed protein product [Peronospora belbahrii]|uniref:BHLH domain-containing protein n=1 Tax=Peronospora belbahrii TaxID=622444 RepID=A0AAU9L032_9STRA|nr:unnamed protein product [Peronospora belbahrii]CAH0514643.1 unnamed protein product [Peronospora belbahrii]